jgi:DNA-directed RNA polymerase subunit RPC12/RpoP
MPNIYPTTGRPRTKGRTKLRDKSLLNPNAKKPIDLLHKTQQDKFKLESDQLETINNEIHNLERKLIKINKDIEDIISRNDIPDLLLEKERWLLEDTISSLKQKYKDIENNTDAKKYLLKSGQILYQYKKIKNNEINTKSFLLDSFDDTSSDNDSDTETDTGTVYNSNNSNNAVKANIFDYIPQSTYKSTLKLNPRSDKLKYDFSLTDIKKKQLHKNPRSKTQHTTNISNVNNNADTNNDNNTATGEQNNLLVDYLKIDKDKEELNKRKKKIYTKYMKLLDPNYIDMSKDSALGFDICIHCKREMVLNHNSGMIQCQNCGISEKIIVNTDKQSHKEPPKEITAFSYQRINHINEIISQLQGKQSTDIPKEIFQKIQNELNKMKIPIENVNKTIIKDILKRKKANKYYEHSVYIMNQLGVPKTTFSREIEEILRELFKQVEPVFEKYCPSTRKNFLKYEYFFYKLFELLEMDEYLHICELPKDPKKTYETERIWKAICKDLKWQFIKSV